MNRPRSHSEIRRQLLQETAASQIRVREMEEQIEASASRSPEPGDLYTLTFSPESSFADLEWLVVEASSETPRRVWVVPADSYPLLGAGDVEVPADQPGGPLALRAGMGLWIADHRLRFGRRSGLLNPDIVDSVRASRQDLGTPSLADLDPDGEEALEHWLDEVVRPARDELEGSSSPVFSSSPPPPSGPRMPLRLLAAALAVAAVGLGAWGFRQSRSAWDSTNPAVLSHFEQVDFGGVRGPTDPLTVEPGRHLALSLALPRELPPEEVLILEVRFPRSGRTWSTTIPSDARVADVVVPSQSLDQEDYLELRLFRDAPAGRELYRERVLPLGPPDDASP